MNFRKCTQKSLEALEAASGAASSRSNQKIEQTHLAYALLEDEDGLIFGLLKNMGIDAAAMRSDCDGLLAKLPKVSGNAENYMSQGLDKALSEAESAAASMKDEYVSVEHLFLGLLRKSERELGEILKKYSVKEKEFLEALKKVRGNRKVTDQNPEGTYDVLTKYGTDLVELARAQKLDPVIGRDDEIRNVIRILSRKTKNNPDRRGTRPQNSPR